MFYLGLYRMHSWHHRCNVVLIVRIDFVKFSSSTACSVHTANPNLQHLPHWLLQVSNVLHLLYTTDENM